MHHLFTKIGFVLLFCLEISALGEQVKTFSNSGFAVNNSTPAFALLVVKNGKVLFKDVGGCAQFDAKKNCVLKATEETAFSICSITKHFISAGILLLEEEGKLSIEEEASQYLELSEKFLGIKIRHLLFHTSGIPDYFPVDIEGIAAQKKRFTSDDVMKKLEKLELNPVGTKMAYSNTGYVLLGKIIEKVSGQSLEEFLKERIFQRFGMKTAFLQASLPSQTNHTFQYSPWPLLKEESWPKVLIAGAEGGIWMSINDYEKWIDAFDQNKIFRKKETMAKYLSKGTLDSGAQITGDRGEKEYSYGFGLGFNAMEYKGKKYNLITHGGGMPGTASQFAKFIDQGLWVVNFNNNATYPSATDLLEQLGIAID